MRKLAVVLAVAATLTAPAAAGAATRDVLFVGNNWDGTADVVDPVTFQRLARLNIVPDRAERMREILLSPDRTGYFLGIRQLVGEGNDQFVDDMFSSHDGRFVYVSRPSFADVVAISLETRRIVWRAPVDGYRADHMAISPDGRRLLVSASTARRVHVLDTATGRRVGEFPSGDQPHENNFSADGSRIFHASIGAVFTPADEPAFDGTKGDRFFQVVDGRTLQVVERFDMGAELEEAGYPDMSAAVRPMALSPDERTVWFQVSFFHGFVEFDLVGERVTRVAPLPISREAAGKRREDYLLDSAHHGLTADPHGRRLCVAGTMSDYAAIVDTTTLAPTIAAHGSKPYWSTNSADGRFCFISFSGDDRVSVVSYAEAREVASISVGDHPQRMRMGTLERGLLGTSPQAATGARLRVRVSPQRVTARRPATVRARVTAPDGAPVAGARVLLAGVRATTDRRGRAVLRKRRGFERARRYRVRAMLRGFAPGTATLRAVRGDG